MTKENQLICNICDIPIQSNEIHYCIEDTKKQLNICLECINNCKRRGYDQEEVKEKYYVCEKCGTLMTQTEIENSVENYGSPGLCDCEFTKHFWNEEYECIDVETLRVYNDYTEINELTYTLLFNEKNHIIRLRLFHTIPKQKRL